MHIYHDISKTDMTGSTLRSTSRSTIAPHYVEQYVRHCEWTRRPSLRDISDRHKWLCFRFLSSFYLFALQFNSTNVRKLSQWIFYCVMPFAFSDMSMFEPGISEAVTSGESEWHKKEDIHRLLTGKCIIDVWMERNNLIGTDSFCSERNKNWVAFSPMRCDQHEFLTGWKLIILEQKNCTIAAMAIH